MSRFTYYNYFCTIDKKLTEQDKKDILDCIKPQAEDTRTVVYFVDYDRENDNRTGIYVTSHATKCPRIDYNVYNKIGKTKTYQVDRGLKHNVSSSLRQLMSAN